MSFLFGVKQLEHFWVFALGRSQKNNEIMWGKSQMGEDSKNFSKRWGKQLEKEKHDELPFLWFPTSQSGNLMFATLKNRCLICNEPRIWVILHSFIQSMFAKSIKLFMKYYTITQSKQ